MRKAIKDKWLKALRSGKYEQGQGTLVSSFGTQFCCLGVLGDVCGVSLSTMYGIGYLSLALFDRGGELSDGELSTLMVDRFGIKRSTEKKLANMNDGEGKNFRQIAAYISRNL
jgi:hypothetical protein